jgi:hypothetical protein
MNKHKRFTDALTDQGLVHHYAPWRYLPPIVRAGELRTSRVGSLDELPLLWFSAHQIWEPTATKVVVNSRREIRQLSFSEQRELHGCVRFGLDRHDPRLMDWETACRFAGTSSLMRRALEKVGKKLGAAPEQWFAISANLSIAGLPFQVLSPELEWCDACPKQMAQAWIDVRGNRAPALDGTPAALVVGVRSQTEAPHAAAHA